MSAPPPSDSYGPSASAVKLHVSQLEYLLRDPRSARLGGPAHFRARHRRRQRGGQDPRAGVAVDEGHRTDADGLEIRCGLTETPECTSLHANSGPL